MNKQAQQLIAMARQLLATDGEADPAGEAAMLKIEAARDALNLAQESVKEADGALDDLCTIVDEANSEDHTGSTKFYNHAAKLTKAIRAFPAVVADFHNGTTGVARTLSVAKLIK